MKEVILTKGALIGKTDQGKNWCLKALHPSDPLVEVTGIPDANAAPSMFVNYQSTFTISPPNPTGSTTPWKFDFALLPHPIALAYWRAALVDDTAALFGNFLNPQVPGASHWAKYDNFRNQYQRWRLAYMSVTVYQDAPALANQGTIVGCQVPVEPRRCTTGFSPAPYTGDIGTHISLSLPPIDVYDADDYPEFTRSQAVPNAYFARSEAGLYMPLKLTRTHQKWRCTDTQTLIAYPLAEELLPNIPLLKECGAAYVPSVPLLADMNTVGPYPFPSLVPVQNVEAVTYSGRTSTAMKLGQCTSEMCNDVWGHISARNLSPQCSYSFFIRAGYEMQVNPSSLLAPQARIPPQQDDLAIEHYFAIARELKDAYPAEYNDLGKMWDVIKSAANAALPFVKLIPGAGQVVSALEPGVRAGVSALEKALMPSTSRDAQPPAATLERARVQLAQRAIARSAPNRSKSVKVKKRGGK